MQEQYDWSKVQNYKLEKDTKGVIILICSIITLIIGVCHSFNLLHSLFFVHGLIYKCPIIEFLFCTLVLVFAITHKSPNRVAKKVISIIFCVPSVLVIIFIMLLYIRTAMFFEL